MKNLQSIRLKYRSHHWNITVITNAKYLKIKSMMTDVEFAIALDTMLTRMN